MQQVDFVCLNEIMTNKIFTFVFIYAYLSDLII